MAKLVFSIPDYYHFSYHNTFFLDLFAKRRDWFEDDVEIGSVYGSFPCIWNGGRYIEGDLTLVMMNEVFTAFANHNVEVRHSFTNLLIDKNATTDTLGNAILRISSQMPNLRVGAILASQSLQGMILKNYPNVQIIWSSALQLEDAKKINKLSEQGKVILDLRQNRNMSLLNSLRNKDNIELIVCASCDANCRHFAKHMDRVSKLQMLISKEVFKCPYGKEAGSSSIQDILAQPHVISPKELREVYVPMGFTHFIITGRTESPQSLLLRYSLYLAKKANQKDFEDIFNQMLTQLQTKSNLPQRDMYVPLMPHSINIDTNALRNLRIA